ncbi:MAG TPA: CotH kinase family protein [Flavobacterium sp.]|uniref:CotH kinase family protein n=1 Tax=Flavobacterium sp. TaxID=239 RepID=UPI002BE37913|nr:CotH kinase family protein [Flavobacterium sp.]HSD14304.1 CotH kinase family protein [Flavobacterium sp.]
MKKITFWILTSMVVLNYDPLFSQNIVINEILTSNNTSITDENGSHEDWIELYNTGSNPVNLLGHGLSDDPAALFKWTFPSVTLNPGQYLIVWASDKNRAIAGSPLHTNFKLSASGETLILTNPSGNNVGTVSPVALQSDISYGRFPNGSGPYVYFSTPTPNAANTTTGYSEALSPPVFSHASEFRTTGFNLTLTSNSPGATILYTLDGSEPNQNNLGGTTYSYKRRYPEDPGQLPVNEFFQNTFRTQTYSGPIAIADRTSQPNKLSNVSTTWDYQPDYFPNGPIFKATVVKAKVIKTGAIPSETVTRNYFISPQGANRFTLPVASISFNENEFYDYVDGISVAGKIFDDWRVDNPDDEADNDEANWGLHGEATERIANLNYFVNGEEKINQKVGLRIHGDHSRIYPNKSLRVYARSDYGNDKLEYPLFSDEPYTAYERVLIKNQGGDWNNTMFRDCLCNELVKDLRMETEAHQQVITVVNGEYWGIQALRERYDDNYFKLVYDIDAVDLLHDHYSIDEGDRVDYLSFINEIETRDLSLSANYTYIQTRMDIENYMDYHISNIFLNNDDWVTNNVVYWRKRTTLNPNAPYPHDGRWRWAFHDVTSTFDDADFDTLEDATTTDEDIHAAWSTQVLRKLLTNATFKNDFINRFADLMNTNFLSSRVVAQINAMAAVIAPEMNDQYFRWKGPVNDGDWQYHLNRERTFATERPNYQRQHIRQKFNINSNINATLDVNDASQGYIKMNTINIKYGTPGITVNPYPWTGVYFHNIPVKIKAVALPGYVFSHWSGASSSTSEEITITPTGNFSVTAHFSPSGNPNLPQIIYFWMMNTDLPNDVPLTDIASTFEVSSSEGNLHYESCLVGYPFAPGNPSYRKASMERRNEPTSINYFPAANQNLTYENSNMRGIQIKQPFKSGNMENAVQLHISTLGYKDIRLAFAVIDQGAATGITVDYSINPGTPVWITTGMSTSSFPISNVYQKVEIDFSAISAVNHNANLKLRIRFTGPNMTADTGEQVTFNNISIQGTAETLTTDENELNGLIVYPNPITNIVYVLPQSESLEFTIYGIDGRKIQNGKLYNNEINLSQLPSGMYIMQLQNEDGKSTVRKIVKK